MDLRRKWLKYIHSLEREYYEDHRKENMGTDTSNIILLVTRGFLPSVESERDMITHPNRVKEMAAVSNPIPTLTYIICMLLSI